ncbi:MAG: hypothetical protein WC924_00410 [Candidatus Gracilibacteria bacterium]
MIKKILLTILAAVLFSFSVDSALAAIQLDDNLRPNNLPTIEIEEAVNDDHPETAATQTLIMFVGNIISQVLLFAGALTIIFLIIAGVNYVIAFGKDERIEKGKLGIVWSLVGLAIILLSYAIVQGVLQIILQVDESAL